MTNPLSVDVLRELAERVERASGPDRELDLAILKVHEPSACHWDARLIDDRARSSGPPGVLVPAYTASLDAAKALFSINAAGRRIEMQETDAGAWVRLTWMQNGFSPQAEARAQGRNALERALTAAGLKSRAIIERNEDA